MAMTEDLGTAHQAREQMRSFIYSFCRGFTKNRPFSFHCRGRIHEVGVFNEKVKIRKL